MLIKCPTCSHEMHRYATRLTELVCDRCSAWLRKDDDRGWFHVEEHDDPVKEAEAMRFYPNMVTE